MQESNMPSTRLCLSIGAALIALPVLAADTLQVKLGLWETTVTINNSAMKGMSIPAEQLAQLPPAQRAQMEQMLKQMSGAKPITSRSCVTQKDLEEGAFRAQSKQDAGKCTYKQVAGTARHQDWTFQCSSAEDNATGKMTLDAPDSTHVQGAVDMKSARGSTSIKLASQWISTSCAGADKD
jgi:hypothetical protein